MRTRVFCVVLLVLASAGCQEERHLRLATTTSVDNSGLLEVLLGEYERSTGTRVDALAVGSGRAIELTRRGDADLMLTHDPRGERGFLDQDRPLLYRKLMCNDFIIVGPPDDPARAADARSIGAALRQIASGSVFASRGDRSGTHTREDQLWMLAGTRPGAKGLLETGQGMAATLRIASEREAYTLTDRPTFLQLRASLDLEVVYDRGESDLLNCYAVTVPPGPREDAALELAEWLSRGRGRELIRSYEVGGERGFRVWPEGEPDDRPESLLQ